MRVFGGIEITEQFVQDLHSEWHENRKTMPSTYEAFIRSNTGWTHEEFIGWVANRRLP